MTDDLVERLRDPRMTVHGRAGMAAEAADAIETLRAERDEAVMFRKLLIEEREAWRDTARVFGARAKQEQARAEKAEAENERLREAIEKQKRAAKQLHASALDQVRHLQDKDRSEYVAAQMLDSERDANARLTEENARLREALEFYAIRARDCRKLTKDGDTARNELDRDGGEVARQALGEPRK